MVVIKYALCGCLIAAGLFGYSKREVVRDAYHWDPTIERPLVRSFDPQAVAEANRLPVPASGIRIAHAPDTRTAPLPAVPTETTRPSVQGGGASITGQVFGPAGQPLAGATVRVQRLVGDQTASIDLTSDSSGSFGVGGLLGGRYRVWAWQVPNLTQLGSEVTFLEEGTSRSYRLGLQAPTDIRLEVEAGSASLPVGQSTSVWMRIGNPVVNSSGQVARVGRAGDLVVASGAGVFSGQGGSGTTNSEGVAAFPILCNTPGPGTVTLATPYYKDSVQINCEAPPPTAPPPTAPSPAPAAGPATPGTGTG